MKKSLKKITVKELASLINKHLVKHGLEAVLTGGSCVTVYSVNEYQSPDLDFVISTTEYRTKAIKEAMEEIGFKRRPDASFVHPNCPYFIEFIAPPLSIGSEPVKNISTIRTKLGYFRLLSPTDCVKDRLAAYYFWDDLQSLEQAKMVARRQKINYKEVKRWSKVEGYLKKFNEFMRQRKKRK